MSPADTTTSPAPGATDELDSTFKLLFDAAASELIPEKKEEPPEPVSSGNSLAQALDDAAQPTAEAVPEKKEQPTMKVDDEPEKPVRVRRRSAAHTAPAVAPVAPPPPPPPAPEPEKPKDTFEDGLLEEEKDQLDLARYAERKDPKKYSGYGIRVEKFLKSHQDYLAKNPKALDSDSEESDTYQEWLKKNSVAIPANEARKMEVRREAEKITDERLKESESKFAEIHDDNFRRDEEPKVKSSTDAFFNKLATMAMPEELTKAVKEHGVDKAKDMYPLEYRVTSEVMTEAATTIEEFKRLTTFNPKTSRPLSAYDAQNPRHTTIVKFITSQCDAFKNSNSKHLVRDGKQFLTRDEYFSIKGDKRGPYWTFSNDDVVKMAEIATKDSIKSRIDTERRSRESDGWVRRAPSSSAPAPSPSGAPPAPRPSQIASGTTSAETMDRSMSLLMGE